MTASVFCLGPRCGGAQYLHVDIKNRLGKLLYEAEGSCIQAKWYTGLYCTSTGVREDLKPVKCPKFSFTRNANGAYRVDASRLP